MNKATKMIIKTVTTVFLMSVQIACTYFLIIIPFLTLIDIRGVGGMELFLWLLAGGFSIVLGSLVVIGLGLVIIIINKTIDEY